MRRNSFKSTRRFERLEDRRMMAGIDLEDGIVTVIGDNTGDLIVITADPEDADEILVTIRNIASGEILEQEDYDRDDVASIRVEARGGNDVVSNNTNITSELLGEGGNDNLIGGSARDIIFGGTEADTLQGRGGNDDLTGGAGSDLYRFFGSLLGSDVVTEAANVDGDTLDFSAFTGGGVNVDLSVTTARVINAGDLTLRLSSSTGIENVLGTVFEDTIRGNSRNNLLSGAGSRDRIFGGTGDDTLVGGAGNDDLFGEGGRDVLLGESGSDFLDGGFDSLNDVLIGGSDPDIFVNHRRTSGGGPVEQSFIDFINGVDAFFAVNH